MAIDFIEETEANPQIDFIPEEEPKPDLSGVKISPYEAEKLKPGYRPMTTLGPVNPEEVLAWPQIALAAPGAVVEPIMSDVEDIAADVLNRTGINPSARPGQPMINVPSIPNLTAGGRLLKAVAPELATGIEKGMGEFVTGFSTPGQAAIAPLAGGKLVQTIFALQAAGATPESIKAIANAKTTEEQGKALAQAAANVGMVYMLGKGLVGGEATPKVLTPPPRMTPPGLPGSVLAMPKGARMPRPEPVAAPERLSPEEAAIQAERMSKEATAAVEPSFAPVSPAVELAKAVLESPVRENGGQTSLILKDGTALVGGKIHAQTFDAAVKLGYPEQEVASATAGFTKPDGTSWDINGKPIQVKSVIDLQKPKPFPVESGKAEPGPVPPAAAVGEVSATQGAVAAASPPAISEPTTLPKEKQPTPPAETPAAKAKQPWEMTDNEVLKLALDGTPPQPWQLKRDVFISVNKKFAESNKAKPASDYALKKGHLRTVEFALKEGKPVPPEVLADYPELSKPTPKAVEAAGEPAPIGQGPSETGKPAEQPNVGPGMGGAIPSEFQPVKPMTTSVKDAALDRDRADRGLPPMMDALRKSDPQLYAQMQNVLDSDWQAADKLIARWKAKPFLPTDVETMVLLHRRVDLKNEYAKADQEYLQANKEGRTEEAQTAKAVRDSMSERLDELDDILGKGDMAMGTMMGRAFRARQLVMREDYTLDALERDYRTRTKSDTVPDAELAKMRELADKWQKIAEEETALAQKSEKSMLEEQAKRIAAQAELDAKKANEPSSYVLKIATDIVASWDKRADAARARIRERMGRTSAGLDPTVLLDVTEIGLSHLGHIGLDFVKWSDAMVKDLDEWIRPHLQEAWEKTKAAANAEIESRKGTATTAEVKKALSPKLSVLAKVQQKYNRMRPEVRENTDLHWDARKIARYFWASGIREPLPLVDAVHQVFQAFIPDITKRQVADAISGYGRFTKLKKDAISVGIRDISGQLQQASKLEDLSKTPPTLKPTGFEQREKSDTERRMIKQVEAKKKEVGYQPTGPEQQLRSAFQATERRLSNKIKDLQFEIDRQQKIVRTKPSPVTNDKIAAMREYLTALKEIHDDVFKPAELTDAERLALWKERAQDWIDKWKANLESGNIHPKKRAIDPRLDKEALELRYRKQEVHKAVLEKRIQWDKKGMNAAQRVASGIVNGMRFSFFLMTGNELSAVLRQGKLSIFGHPIIGSKALVPMFKALASEKNQFKINEEIQTRENAPLYVRDKLQFTEAGVRLSTMEEMNMFRISERMLNFPVLKYAFRSLAAFQRAYTTYLNVLRADLYDSLTAINGNDPVMGERMANFINVTTGRGSASLARRLGPGPNTILFAPRWSMSRLQFLMGQPLWHGDMRTRKAIAKEYARIFAGAAVIYTLGIAAGGKVEKDPRSGGGWVIAFGNKKIDPLAGLTQFTRLIARLTTGWNKNQAGRMVPLRGGQKFFPTTDRFEPKYGQMTAGSVLYDFGRRKLAPFPGTAVSAVTGEYPGRQKFNLKDTIIQHSMPITYGDIYKIMTSDEKIPANVALSLLNFFGETVQVWDEDKSRNPK